MNLIRKACAGRLWEGGRHAFSKFRTINMKVLIEGKKKCIIAMKCKRQKTVNKKKRVDETNPSYACLAPTLVPCAS